MKKIVLLWIAIVALASHISAQCISCVPTYSGCSPNGGICGHAVAGMANHPYTTNISFYMPHQLHDPAILSQCSCSEVDLKEIKITGVGGLPIGITPTFNHATADYNVQNGDTLGCANFCGTPLAPGIYPITIYIEAHVEAIGTPVGNIDPGAQNQTYLDTMVILPDTSGAVSSFSYTPHVKSDCDSVRLAFDALLSAPAPNPTGYEWNFGNGNTSTAKTPSGSYLYNTPGIHPVSLRTIFYQYRVKKIFITVISGGYYPDVEEPFSFNNPDPYFIIGSLGFVSNVVQDQKTNVSFDTIIPLPLGTDSFKMVLMDKDQSVSPTITPDDSLGVYTIHIIPGQTQYNWSNGNASGYIEFDTVFGTSIVDTLRVNIEGRPIKPTVLISGTDSICYGDSARLVISPQYANVKYEWWRDSVFLVTATDSAIYAHDAGLYRVRVTNLATGCSSASDTPYTRLSVSGIVPSSANVYYNAGTHNLFVTPFIPGSVAQWYYDSVLVTGQSSSTLPSLGYGVYKVVVSPQGYPQCNVTSNNYTLLPTGLMEATNDIYALTVYPNPTNGTFAIKANILTLGEVSLKITDMLGREVYQSMLTNQNGEIRQNVDISGLAKDVYTLTVSTPAGKATKRIVVK